MADSQVSPRSDFSAAEPNRHALAAQFLSELLRGARQLGMYRHNPARFPEFLQRAHGLLDEYLHSAGPMRLKVEPQNFSLQGVPLFTDETPVPFRFYREGIRELTFRPGVTMEELVTFTQIAISDADRGAEEINTQLWRASFDHLEYLMVDGLKMGDLSEEEVEIEVDSIVNYLQARLVTETSDALRFARISSEDLDVTLQGVEQLRGLVIRGVTAEPQLKARLQKELEEEETHHLFPKLVNASFQLVERGFDEPELLEELLTQLLDALLFQEDFQTLNQVLDRLRSMADFDLSRPNVGHLRDFFVAKMGEEQRLMRVAEVLRTGTVGQSGQIGRYLQALNPEAVPALLDALETIELPDSRALVCEAIYPMATRNPEPFIERLGSDKPQTVRDIIFILEKSKHPDRIAMFGTVLQSKNLALRLEVMSIIGSSPSGEARKLILQCLHDDSSQARLLAARLLPNFGPEPAYVELKRSIDDRGFPKRPLEERQGFFAALGSTGQPAAISFFSTLLTGNTRFWRRGRDMEERLCAIAGLQGASTIQSYRLLNQVAEDKTQEPEVISAARRAMAHCRRALFGDGTEKDSVDG